jgi:hypothetical protein
VKQVYQIKCFKKLVMNKSYFLGMVILLVPLLFVQACSKKTKSVIEVGKGVFVFDEYEPLVDKPVRVFTYRPEGDVASMPILFVMHGTLRNADDYRDNWIEIADEYGVLVVTPEFDSEDFPGSRGYNLGGMFDEDGNQVGEQYWAYSLIEPIFDQVLEMTDSKEAGYDIFGHSAGAQFTHRLFLFKEGLRANHVISANAGWYTMPDFEIEFPYGLKNTAVDEKALTNRLESRMLIQLGEEDNDPNHRFLRTADEAMRQGAHRFERGHNFYEKAQKIADNNGSNFQWSIRTVPEVGHENAKMAIDIADYLFRN